MLPPLNPGKGIYSFFMLVFPFSELYDYYMRRFHFISAGAVSPKEAGAGCLVLNIPLLLLLILVLSLPLFTVSCNVFDLGGPSLAWYVREGGDGSGNTVYPGSRVALQLESRESSVPQLIYWSVRMPGEQEFSPLDALNQGVGGPRNPVNLLLNTPGSYDIRAQYSFNQSNFSDPVFQGAVVTTIPAEYPDDPGGAWPAGSPEHRHTGEYLGSYVLTGEYNGGTGIEISFRLSAQRIAEILPLESTSAGDPNTATDPGLVVLGEADISLNSGSETGTGAQIYALSYPPGGYPGFSPEDLAVYIPLEPSGSFPSLLEPAALLLRIPMGLETPEISKNALWSPNSGNLQDDFLESWDLLFTSQAAPLEDLYADLWLDEYKYIHPEF